MDLALLAPVVLLLLMLLLGRFERWLDRSTPCAPPPEPHRWRRPARAVRSASVAVGAGRRLAHRTSAAARRRPAAASASLPRAARGHLLGGRPRPDR